MISRKSKLDLLVKVRYQNPLPPPPCPPKLLHIPTNPKRYTRPEFLDAATNEALLPMVVDAECGMPLDLGKWEALWEDGADDRALNPDPRNPPLLDPKDQALLLDPAGNALDFGRHHTHHGHGHHAVGTPPVATHVSWLRKTEYISRDSSGPAPRPAAVDISSEVVDISREAQLASIESSFAAARGADQLGALRHPTKPRLRALATYEVLPDADVWANAYDLFRFSERPGERGPELDDPRLDCAIMRPMESDGDHFLSYYLTKDDDAAEQFKDSRGDPRGIDSLQDEEEATEFHFVRDYEVVKVEQEVPNEFLLVFDEGDVSSPTSNGLIDGEAPRAGAYYKVIERKMLLKKKRTEPIERFRDKWALVRVAHVPPSQEEADERAEALAEVRDPMYLLQSADAEGEDDADADADGDGDADVDGQGEVVVGVVENQL
ncbi:RNA polymerase II-associated [Russula earlei]|uniref:RNA polymerase II-associated n=2 Tax=Russula earlei TaxID=71964 RepID=A0ACC0TVI0_9AGAM|nr:RNA polymerase II-associated [Russula earlei]KAI9450758.1 RNA polymerase II-associated [Russula earlei]